MMQILPEYRLTVLGVLDRLQDVRVPELIDVLAEKNVFGVILIFRQHGEIGPIPLFDTLRVLARPTLPQLGVHQSDLYGFEIKGAY